MLNLAQNTSQKKDDYGEIAQVISFPKPSLIQEAIVGIKKSENGYTKTPNYLVDDDYLVRMTGNALKCYVVINRFSEGFSRQNWAMESKFLQRKTGIKKPHTLFEAVKQLEELKLLSVHREDGKTNKFTIMHPCLKTAVPNSGTTAENGQWSSTENGHSTTAENGHTKKETFKENIKENFKEEIPQENSVDAVLNLWTPDLHSLNSWLQRSGEMPMTQELVNQVLLEINAHYEPRLKSGQLTDSQMYANFVKWMKRKFTPKQKSTSEKQDNRNVNDAWNNIPEFQGEIASVEIPEDFV